MELKQGFYMANGALTILLIVPYGIETYHIHPSGRVGSLLIVPYGIETRDKLL